TGLYVSKIQMDTFIASFLAVIHRKCHFLTLIRYAIKWCGFSSRVPAIEKVLSHHSKSASETSTRKKLVVDPYPCRFDAYPRLNLAVSRHFEQEACLLSHSTFCGRFMSQFPFRAKLCVREIVFDSSIQAQGTGDFMSQNWRGYGNSYTPSCLDRQIR